MPCGLFQTGVVSPGGGGNMLPRPYDPDYPASISMQTEWPCYVFDFSRSEAPLKPGTDYLNCGLCARPDGDYLFVRRCEWRANLAFGMNDVIAFRLQGVTPTTAHGVPFSPSYPNEHFEDPRALYHNGHTWVSGTNFVWHPRFSGSHQILVQVDQNWRLIRRYDPDFGGNGPALYTNQRWQKNWVWFFHEDQLHMVYYANPHHVVRFDKDARPVQEWNTANPGLRYDYGELRGGTPPTLVDGEYWTFFHSSVDWCPRGGKRYHMGAYSFEGRPPFRLLRYTPRPLLSGSDRDRNSPDKPLVVFPCGAIIRNGKWLVSFGVNDLDSAFIRIPHEDLIKQTTPLKRTAIIQVPAIA